MPQRIVYVSTDLSVWLTICCSFSMLPLSANDLQQSNASHHLTFSCCRYRCLATSCSLRFYSTTNANKHSYKHTLTYIESAFAKFIWWHTPSRKATNSTLWTRAGVFEQWSYCTPLGTSAFYPFVHHALYSFFYRVSPKSSEYWCLCMCAILWNCHEKLDYKILFATSFVAAALPIYALLGRASPSPSSYSLSSLRMPLHVVHGRFSWNLTVLHVCGVVSGTVKPTRFERWINFEYSTRCVYCQYLLLLQGCVIFHRWMTTFKFDILVVEISIHIYCRTYVRSTEQTITTLNFILYKILI